MATTDSNGTVPGADKEVLRWRDLSLTVTLKDKPEGLAVLKPMSGVVRRGELVAIMGASGAGKTSLLDVLAKRTLVGVKGQMLYNGAELSRREAQSEVAYVQQDDLLFPTLTVYEQLDFAAKMLLR